MTPHLMNGTSKSSIRGFSDPSATTLRSHNHKKNKDTAFRRPLATPRLFPAFIPVRKLGQFGSELYLPSHLSPLRRSAQTRQNTCPFTLYYQIMSDIRLWEASYYTSSQIFQRKTPPFSPPASI